jgi:hypothetical protein
MLFRHVRHQRRYVCTANTCCCTLLLLVKPFLLLGLAQARQHLLCQCMSAYSPGVGQPGKRRAEAGGRQKKLAVAVLG